MDLTLTETIKQMRVLIAEVHELFLGKEKVRVSEVVDALHEAIVNDYDGSSFPNYKSRWNFTVVEYFKPNQIELIKNPKPNWEPICADIIENLVANTYDFQGRQKRRASTATTSTSATSTTNDMSSEAVPVKQVKLAEIDKDRIKNMYASMDKSKMWKLSTGKLVEEQMQKLALSKDHEHLAHSLVLNVQDHCWQEYFTDSELDEIKYYKAIELPVLPSNVQVLLDDLKTTANSNLYNKVTQEIHASTSDEKWVQDAYNTCFRLIQSGVFPLSSDITEQAIGKRMWSCLDACFDFSNIRCIT
ncbi:hypothetical protein MAM1_0985d11403 [Mucor ambiguus]|uniref:Uncharacterized protein n=1 Tax=Mucor ambiguus TaxID=91626 RepID=A0A0C9N6X2_9FUNG|nr:hypothetical protein MAM1_0985d11403 [Mucor ambiguus]